MSDDFSGYDEDERYAEENEIRCKYCRKRDLLWQEGRGEHNRKKWVLVDENGDIHDCRKAVSVDDFPVVTPT